jgi:membrane-bound serine protease (ClpP class)
MSLGHAWLQAHPLSPDAAVLLLTAGLLLIYWELNRPGMIVPGATGLLAILLAAASLASFGLRRAGLLLTLGAATTFALQLRFRLNSALSAAAVVALFAGLLLLVAGSSGARVHLPVALAASLLLGAGTTLLTGIARRARRNKAVN